MRDRHPNFKLSSPIENTMQFLMWQQGIVWVTHNVYISWESVATC